MVAAVSKRRRRGEEEEEEEEEGEEVEEGEDAGEIEERERPVPARLQSKVLAVSVLGSAEGRGGKRSTAGKRSVDESSRGRNVRMLGALTKHLSAARKSLDGDRHLIEKQTHAQHCALQRNEKSAEQAIILASERAKEEKHLRLQKRKYLEDQRRKEARELSTAAWIAKQEQMKTLLLTRATPHLTWLPSEHTETTSDMLSERAAAIDAEIDVRREEDKIFFSSLCLGPPVVSAAQEEGECATGDDRPESASVNAEAAAHD